MSPITVFMDKYGGKWVANGANFVLQADKAMLNAKFEGTHVRVDLSVCGVHLLYLTSEPFESVDSFVARLKSTLSAISESAKKLAALGIPPMRIED